MRTKLSIVAVVAALLFYAVLIGYKGIALLVSGSAELVVLGLALLLLPILGLLLVWREVQFGRHMEKLAHTLEAEGGLPVDDLPRRPSGRVDRDAADVAFDRMREEAQQHPDDWRTWFRLALAYDVAGDRTRARAAARHALELHS